MRPIEPRRLDDARASLPLGDLERAGFTLVAGVESPAAAAHIVGDLLGRLPPRRYGPAPGRGPGVVLPPKRIPSCREMTGATFQALHFDFGAPLHRPEGERQFDCSFVAIYRSPDGPDASAETRVVQVADLVCAMAPGDRIAISSRLPTYAARHSDGWSEPEPHRTGRIACLARFLDCLNPQPELDHFFDQGTWAWFRDGEPSPAGADELERERAWFARWGVPLVDLEHRARLRPGDLLIVDNVRCAHGRVGPRTLGEVHQIIVGEWIGPESPEDDYASYLRAVLLGPVETPV